MVRRCVAAGCSNTSTSTVNLFKFPKDPVLLAKWVRQVRRTRAQWEATEHSVLCSEHFTEDYFEVNAALAQSFGMSKRRRLKEGAIPTIFKRMSAKRASTSSKRSCNPWPDTPTAPPKRPYRAVEKRDRVMVSNCTCYHTSMSIYMYTNDCLFTSVNNNLLHIVDELLSQPSTSAAVTIQECED